MTLPEGGEKCRKNEHVDSPESTPAKKLKLEITPAQTGSQQKQEVSLLDLSYDELLIICYYLGPTDLLALSQSSTRLEEIVRDRTLWINVDFEIPKTEQELKQYLKFFLPSTKTLVTYGFKNDSLKTHLSLFYEKSEGNEETYTLKPEKTSITQEFIEQLSEAAPNLKSFISENHFIDGSKLLLEHFPSSLEQLSFKNSEVFNRETMNKSYFSGFDKSFPNLKVLDLTNCHWFTSHSFLALSKSQTLESLILRGCPQINDCVPYVSLGFRFGFHALKVLDLRYTHVTDRELGCINLNKTLQELYLEAPPNEGVDNITDVGITLFGNVMQMGRNISNMVLLLMAGPVDEQSKMPVPIKKLIVRNYNLVTDTSLRHAAACLTHLNYIDVTGTGCSLDGVTKFRKNRSNVTIISNFDAKS